MGPTSSQHLKLSYAIKITLAKLNPLDLILMKNTELDQDAVEDFFEDFLDQARLNRVLEKVATRFKRRFGDSIPEIEAAYEMAREELGFTNQRHLHGTYKREKEGDFWYRPQLELDTFWPSLRSIIEADLGEAIESIDATSTQVVNGLRPSNARQNTKGLVLGHVQSGKTTNFLSVIAKAADAGFRLFIVLTGITDNLRQQTQERIDEQLIDPVASRWTKLTDIESDFSGDKNAQRLANHSDRFIAVVKKNSARLQRLNEWLNEAGTIADTCPILIIDDEADQASIDVSARDKQEKSAINQQINTLLDHDITAYIAYTATPFANILIDPSKEDDLYPSDFIVTLPEPKGYFGSRALFGREPLQGEGIEDVDPDGYDMIRHISDEEVEGIRPRKSDEGSKIIIGGEALQDAIRWFLMATAARRARGQHDKHSSMLIHTSMLTDDHDELSFQVKHELKRLKEELYSANTLPETWVTQWTKENTRVPAEQFGLNPVTIDELKAEINGVVQDVDIVIDNGRSAKRLNYREGPQTVIAIGGNTLSRGLTLEGLVSSYFVRRASAYDTLLQMGRWFGFRNGYQDLPRIWIPDELNSWFRDLSTVEAELREELDVYIEEQVSPLQVQARIRLHPAMMITSQAKMRDAVDAQMSFSGKKEQTILFREKDTEWLLRNRKAARSLIQEMQRRGLKQREGAYRSPVFTHVNGELILDFLDAYQIHEDARLGKNQSKLLKKYVRQETESGRIKTWNVSVMTQHRNEVGTDDLGLGEMQMVNRAKLANSKLNAANIKALVTTSDRLNDVVFDSEEDRADFRRMVDEEIKISGKKEGTVRRLHDKYAGIGVGHLAIYPIAADSKPRTKYSDEEIENRRKQGGKRLEFRVPLEANANVIGLGIFFPTSNAPESRISYVSAPETVDFTEDYRQMGETIHELRANDAAALESEVNEEKE